MGVDPPYLRRLALRHEQVVHGPDELALHREHGAACEHIERDIDRALQRVLHRYERFVDLVLRDGLQHVVNVAVDDQPPRLLQPAVQVERRRLAVRARRPQNAHRLCHKR